MSDLITIRMYNTGFGDSFLLTFPADRPRKVLIDCGMHQFGPGPFPAGEVVDQILADVDEPDGPRIDIVVATHRHRDHVSGFEHKSWDKVRVAEVWMPWTEHPTDPEARSIRERQSSLAQRLCLAIQQLNLDAAERDYRFAFAQNNLSNAEAMTTLHEGFKDVKRRRFLPHKNGKRTAIQPACLPGVEIHALGPSRDPKVIRDMKPPEGESYLRVTAEDGRMLSQPSPFPASPGWTRGEFDALLKELDCQELLNGFSAKTAAGISSEGVVDEMAIATSLETAVNGTSLVLMFRMGKAHLLFPGDAQWGTWREILDDTECHPMLRRTSFYKVGHHGSHNATPPEFVETFLPKGALAMIPTRPMTRWPFIPKAALLTALTKYGVEFARSDEPPSAPSRFTCQERNGKTFSVTVEIPV
ncbi:MAG: hypothetical protein HY235_04555 [Acidobacteria bacterium]|nr:hypothetical protein [Acidobacteriota bacterium]